MTTLANCSAKIMALLHILKQEGKFLRSGKLGEIAPIIETKAIAMRDVEIAIASLQPPELAKQLSSYIEALDKMGKENGRLLQGVLAGARAARLRLETLQNREAQVGTYDVRGNKHSLSAGVRRANKVV